MNKRGIKEILFYTAMIFLMVMSLNLAIKDLSGMDIGLAKMMIYSMVIVFCTVIIAIYPMLNIGIFVFICGSVLYVYFLRSEVFYKVIEYSAGFFNWVYNYVIGLDYFNLKYSVIFGILFIFLTSLIVTLLVFSERGRFLILLLGTAIMTFFWFIFVEKAKIYLLLYVFAAVLLYSYSIYKKKRIQWEKSQYNVEGNVNVKWLINSSIIVLTSIIIVLLLPINIKPVRWTWLNNKVVEFFPKIMEWRNDSQESYYFGYNSRYDMKSTGFSNEKLGGPVSPDKSVMLSVNTYGLDTVYLRGVIKNKYIMNRWNKSKTTSFKHAAYEGLQLPYSKELKTYKASINITPVRLITSSIFAPNSLYKVNTNFKEYYVDGNSEAHFSKNVTSKTSYTIESIMPYIDESELRGISVKAYDKIPEDIELHDGISERVKQLSREITSKYKNDYDKAKAIEGYLRQNYKYTLKPSKVPNNKEFVDYFLFEGKEGYCTYFATAMAVLLRASDIPCRYVEGFLVKDAGSAMTVEVKGSDAHAWVEVNFGDYGWINFEPTPAYSTAEYKNIKEYVENTPARQDNTVNDINKIIPTDNVRNKNLEKLEDTESSISSEQGIKTKNKVNLDIVWLSILIIIIIRILYMMSVGVIMELGIRMAKNKKYINRYLKYMLKYYKQIGININKDDTIREYAMKVKNDFNTCLESCDDVFGLIEKVLYSEKKLSEKEVKTLENFRKSLRKAIKERIGISRFLWRFYLLGR